MDCGGGGPPAPGGRPGNRASIPNPPTIGDRPVDDTDELRAEDSLICKT